MVSVIGGTILSVDSGVEVGTAWLVEWESRLFSGQWSQSRGYSESGLFRVGAIRGQCSRGQCSQS